jgi:hypothetical protein
MHLFDARLEYQFLILKQKKTLFSLVNIRLQQEGITTLLLSGDREEAVASIGSTVGIKNENTVFADSTGKGRCYINFARGRT